MFDVTKFDVTKFDTILARGLSHGLGKPGEQVCIEAAICETLGLSHGDDPQCVSDAVRALGLAQVLALLGLEAIQPEAVIEVQHGG
jgi:hypothetical protein